jgi:hypothetical protein
MLAWYVCNCVCVSHQIRYSPYLVIAGGEKTEALMDVSNPCNEKAKTY